MSFAIVYFFEYRYFRSIKKAPSQYENISLGRTICPWYHLTSQAVCLCAHAPITVGIRPLLLREDPRSEKRLAGELQPLGPFGELTPTAPSLRLCAARTFPVIAFLCTRTCRRVAGGRVKLLGTIITFPHCFVNSCFGTSAF